MKTDLSRLDHSLVICPDSYRKQILKRLYEERKICDVKFMDRSTYFRKYYFDYDFKAVKFLRDEYGLSIANAKEILDHLYPIDPGKEYKNEKLNLLREYRKRLDEEDLLIYDPSFPDLLKDRNVIVMGYGDLLPEQKRIIDGEIVSFEEKEKKYTVSVFEQIEDETAHLYDSICDLLDEGIDINRIHVLNASPDYESYFRRYNTYYHFSIAVDEKDTLISTKEAADFLSKISECSKQDLYEQLRDRDPVCDKLIGIINAYPEEDLNDVRDFIISDLENTKIGNVNYRNIVSCEDLFAPFAEDDHVFLIGFNDSFPAFAKDNDFIPDSLCEELGLSDCRMKNALMRKNVRAYLSGICDLKISYCEKSPFSRYEFSNLFFQDEYEKIKGETAVTYSDGRNRSYYASLLDQFYRYNSVNEDLAALCSTYGDIGYLEYDNRFNGLNQKQLEQIPPIRLSYSTMDRFWRCSFAYYIENILGLNEYEDTFYTLIGTLCHEVLKDLFREQDFDFERSWNRQLTKLSEKDPILEKQKESFFVSKVKEELKEDIAVILKPKSMTKLDDQICEQGFMIDVDDGLVFKGYIDKVMYHKSEDEVIADVVDYKTGNSARIQKKLMPYGLCLQLPSYMYLLSKNNPFNKPIRFGGFYLQHLINTQLNFDEEKDAGQIKEESMKLEGFTSDDLSRLEYTDNSIEDGTSKIIRGLRLKNDGSFYGNAPVLSDADMEEMIRLTDELIRKAGERIKKGDFAIDPKEIDGINESCRYCPYFALCYMRYSDLKVISTKEVDEDA